MLKGMIKGLLLTGLAVLVALVALATLKELQELQELQELKELEAIRFAITPACKLPVPPAWPVNHP